MKDSIEDGQMSKRRRPVIQSDDDDDATGEAKRSKKCNSAEDGTCTSISPSDCASLTSSSPGGVATTTCTTCTGAATTTIPDSDNSVSMSSSSDDGGGGGKKKKKNSGSRASREQSSGRTKPQNTTAVSLQENNGFVVQRPHPNDVLCGRGPGFYSHNGNVKFREFVNERKDEYVLASTNNKKTAITNDVLERMRRLDPPARFLERTTGKQWIETSLEKRFAKTSQALREGVSTIRVRAREAKTAPNPNDDERSKPSSVRTAIGQGTTGTGEAPNLEELTSAQLKTQCELIMNGYALESGKGRQAPPVPVASSAAPSSNAAELDLLAGLVPPFGQGAQQAAAAFLTFSPSAHVHVHPGQAAQQTASHGQWPALAAASAASVQNQLLTAAANFNLPLQQPTNRDLANAAMLEALNVLWARDSLDGTCGTSWQ